VGHPLHLVHLHNLGALNMFDETDGLLAERPAIACRELHQLSASSCRFVVTDFGVKPALFCAQPVAYRSYCEAHADPLLR
jgi:hypothetical protein